MSNPWNTNDGHVCDHGTKIYRARDVLGIKWTGWFCPRAWPAKPHIVLPRTERVGACATDWVE